MYVCMCYVIEYVCVCVYVVLQTSSFFMYHSGSTLASGRLYLSNITIGIPFRRKNTSCKACPTHIVDCLVKTTHKYTITLYHYVHIMYSSHDSIKAL